MKTVLKKITPFISILFFGFAVWFLDHELRQHDLGEITRQLSDIPFTHVLASLFLSFLSYLVLTGYDGLGVRYIGEKLSAGRIIRAGFISYAFSHNIGLALITGGSMRYRIYSAWGFSGIQVTQVVAFSAWTLWIGFCSVAGLSLIFATPEVPGNLPVPFIPLKVLGAILLVIVAGYLWGSIRINKNISFKGWSFSFPDLPLALQQVVLASIDWLMAASVLYVLLPASEIGFFSFTGVFLLAQIIGLSSQVPGGLGVFESVMLVYLSNFMTGTAVLGTLLVYRVIYYILPLLVAMAILGYQEYITNQKMVREFGQKAADWFPRVMPHVLSISIFISGAMLLFTGAVPAEIPQLNWLQSFLPLPVIEMSHFFASIVGAGLLVLAHGLQRRIDVAYHLTVGLVAAGVMFSFFRGADYVEASILAVMLGALLPCKKEFYREASLLSQRFSTGWISTILIVIFSSVLLGVFSYGNTEYQNDLWWHFMLLGDAPHYIRASVAILACMMLFGFIQLLKPKPVKTGKPEEYEVELAERIVEQSWYANSNLVFLKDKKLLFNDDHTAFIMYAIEGRSWVSMGDPVGPIGELEDLVWRYRDLCDEYDAWPVFYQVRKDHLELYADLGLTRLKLGEEAKIPLNTVDPQAHVHRSLMNNHKEVCRAGYSYEVVPGHEVANYLPRLRSISDAWLQQENDREKQFSLGHFDPGYLRHFPAAVVWHDDEIVAFSNIFEGAGLHEISIDLLRYLPGTHEHIIDYLLMETMFLGKRQRYDWLNLGMAPLSGMERHEKTPGWNTVADLVFTYSENFYNFKGVREYKNRFNPVWEPKFLVCPGGLAIPGVVTSLTSLISGGLKGLISK